PLSPLLALPPSPTRRSSDLDILPDFDSGTILIGILGHPFKCPPAPFEGALLLHDYFEQRGIRAAVEIRVIGPMAAPVPITKDVRSEEHTSELQSRVDLVCRL